jgi:4-hydroxybenzoate polyprenyltransferase
MEETARRLPATFASRWLLRVRIVHPFPTVLNALACFSLAIVASASRPDWVLALRMAATMLLIQSAIGASNDYCDRDLDALSKPGKPIVAGVVSPRAALVVAGAAAGLAAALAATLGPRSWLLAMAGLGLGLLYNVRLKRTVLSALPYLVALPLLPVWVWATVGAGASGIVWLLPLGALAGLALHLTNALADFDGDRVGGASGLAQRLGQWRALLIAWASMALALVLMAVLAPLATARPSRVLAGAGAGLVLLLAAMAISAARSSPSALRIAFGLLGVATAVCGLAWLASGA